jgi:16S rRNA (adenine1518-N6/adenine1519-N6)-dimethyltransferase
MAHRAKKSLGQHFLRSTTALKAMVSSGTVSANDTVLEIGPGEGVLTRALLATGAKVIAVEFDNALIPLLQETFSSEIASGQLRLIEADILKWNPSDHGLSAETYKLVANIPYYITGAIFEKFLTEKNYPSCMVVLIQKEVATRIVARDNKESILSLSVKAFGIPKITMKVPASAFRPAPKVDSAVLAITAISRDNFTSPAGEEATQHNMKYFFDIIHAAFAHKRKLVARNLESVVNKELITTTFANLGISAKARAEDISLPIWITLAKAFGVES